MRPMKAQQPMIGVLQNLETGTFARCGFGFSAHVLKGQGKPEVAGRGHTGGHTQTKISPKYLTLKGKLSDSQSENPGSIPGSATKPLSTMHFAHIRESTKIWNFAGYFIGY